MELQKFWELASLVAERQCVRVFFAGSDARCTSIELSLDQAW